ncbi:MAG: hypothetical protein K2K35_10330, partial [Lachnospiraceae bacterium]|nr:hypothetical protein [Lachnospiraceae bacterium]
MKKLKEQPLKFTMLGFTIFLILGVPGCSLENYNNRKDPETVSSNYSTGIKNTPSSTPKLKTPDGNQDSSKNADTSVSSGYYLSLGVLDGNVVRNGAGRDEAEVAITGNRVVFPQGGIRSISIKSWSRKEKAYNPAKDEIIQYVDALESAVIVDGVPENVLEGMGKIETHI